MPTGDRMTSQAGGEEPTAGAGSLGLERALARVGDRWTLLIVQALLGGPQRFSQLQGELGGIAATVLTQRLRQLESSRLVVAEAYSSRPVRYSYRLTAMGESLAGALRLLAHWGNDHGGDGDAIVHDACGTPAEPRWWCPTCERVVADDELDQQRWV